MGLGSRHLGMFVPASPGSGRPHACMGLRWAVHTSVGSRTGTIHARKQEKPAAVLAPSTCEVSGEMPNTSEVDGVRNDRRRFRLKVLAATLWVAALSATLINLTLLVLNRETQAPTGLGTSPTEVFFSFGYLLLATAGIAIVARNTANRLGWILVASGLALSLAACASEYATYALLTRPGSLPAARAVAWFGAWAWWAGAGSALTAGLFLYPAGSAGSGLWRRLAWVAAGNVVILVFLHAFSPGRLDGEYAIVTNPLGIEGARHVLRPIRNVGWLLLAANAALGFGSVLARLRTSYGPHRQQLTWLGIAAGGGMAATLVWGATRTGDELESPFVQLAVVGGAFALPLAVVAALARNTALQRSVERLVLAREEERRRIRRDLHDGLGPTLAGLGLQLELANSLVRSDPDAAQAILQRLDDRVKVAVRDIRALVDDLRPPILDQLGLESAIEEGTSYLTRHTTEGRFTVSVDVTGNVDGLPAALEVTAFRIVMEAVTNACRHSGASICRVRLVLDRALKITVEDDGVGMSGAYESGVGLSSMRERAAQLGGTCRLEPRSGGGTVVRAELPLSTT